VEKVGEYQVRAAECLALAQKAVSPSLREALLQAAKSWDMLANSGR